MEELIDKSDYFLDKKELEIFKKAKERNLIIYEI